jgi:hypothetical protein
MFDQYKCIFFELNNVLCASYTSSIGAQGKSSVPSGEALEQEKRHAGTGARLALSCDLRDIFPAGHRAPPSVHACESSRGRNGHARPRRAERGCP